MTTRTNTIHDDIILELDKKINEAIDGFNPIMAEMRTACENGYVPNSGSAYESFVRGLRKKILLQLEGIKTWLGTHVLSTVVQQVRTSGVYRLHETKEAITAAEAEKQKTLEERQRIYENDNTLTDFEKYSLYGHPEFERSTRWKFWHRRKQTSSSLTREVSPDAELVYRKYTRKRNLGVFIGLVVTAICVAIDFRMIAELFLSANYTSASANIIAIIAAAMLDAPPYVLGFVWTKSDDDRSLLELQGNANTPDGKRKIKGNNILFYVMLTVICLSFLAYLSVRILSFLGGGEGFNLAFHTILEGNWSKLKDVDFSGADFLSTVVPIATSVVALAVGKMLYSMRTDYIKESVIIIKNEINEKIKTCDDRIVDCEKRIRDLEDSMVTLKREIWTFYQGRKPFPTDDDSFRTEVSLAFQKLNLSLYQQTYSDCCLHLRNQAMAMLRTVNDQLAQYAADQPSIINMGLSRDEEQCLDEFWVIPSSGTTQSQTTQTHLSKIESIVNELLNGLR